MVQVQEFKKFGNLKDERGFGKMNMMTNTFKKYEALGKTVSVLMTVRMTISQRCISVKFLKYE